MNSSFTTQGLRPGTGPSLAATAGRPPERPTLAPVGTVLSASLGAAKPAVASAWFALMLAAMATTQQFSPAALLPGDNSLAASAGNQSDPAVALGGNGLSLAVWEDDRSSLVDSVFGGQSIGSSVPGNVDIYGVLLDVQGQPVTSAPFVVRGGTWDELDPKVAWNGTEYLVVFSSTRPTASYFSRGIYGVRVAANGTVIDTTPIRIDDDESHDEQYPAVASLNGRWLVAWTDVGQTGYELLNSCFVAANGTVGGKTVIVQGQPGQPPTELEMAASNGRFALVWSIGWSVGVHAVVLDANAIAVGAVVNLESGAGQKPGIGTDGNSFYVAWYSGASFALRGTPLSSAGVAAIPGGAALLPAPFVDPRFGVGHNGTDWLVAYVSNPDVRATRVAANGTPSGTSLLLTSSSRQVADIAVANGTGRSLVLWTDTRTTPSAYGADIADVFGCTVATNGTASPAAVVSSSPPAQVHARIAGDPATGFLVAYVSLSAGSTRFMAVALNAEGVALAPPFVVHAGDRSLSGVVDVAWNGHEFLVTWTQLQGTSTTDPPPNVYFRRCRLDGTMLDAAPVLVMAGHSAVVDAVGRQFLIVGRHHHPILQSTALMRCRRVDGQSGAFLDATPTVVVTGANNPVDVVGMQDRWLVLLSNMQGAFVLNTGVPQPPFHAADVASSTTRFHVAVNESRDEAVVAYQYRSSSPHRTDVHMRRIRLDGTSPDPLLGPVVSAANQAQLRPTVASLDGEYLFAWADHRDSLDYEPGLGDVFAARLGPQGNLLDPNGIAVHDGPLADGAPTLIRSGRGRALHVAAVMQEGAYGTHRLMVSGYANAAAAPWSRLGTGLAGVAGVPTLDGYGTLLPQASFELNLAGARPFALSVLVLGVTVQNTPVFGGVLVPIPMLTLTAGTAGDGSLTFTTAWPAGLSGVSLYAQYWIVDAAGPQGFASTAAVRGIAP